MRGFVERNFYVDDGLTSLPTEENAVDLVKRTQQALWTNGNLRLHKIASNRVEVIKAFSLDDRAKDLKELDLGLDTLPLQRTLGLVWDLMSDTFTFRVSSKEKPFTRRGILSTVNSLFGPMGFVAPVIVQAKILLRDLTPSGIDWDEPLPIHQQKEWEEWRQSLKIIGQLQIPRTYVSVPLSDIVRKEVHIFSDASEKAIAAVAYLKTTDRDGHHGLSFLLGKAKVAPKHGHTIPRLELCASVLVGEIAEMISDQLDISPDAIYVYSDSRVVLGYIHNQSRRFHTYVCNRVERIRKSSSPEHWTYVPTDKNPADQATRPLPPEQICDSTWLKGPSHLLRDTTSKNEPFFLVDPDNDQEVRRQLVVMTSRISARHSLGSHRFERFSCWERLLRAIVSLKATANKYHCRSKDSNTCLKPDTIQMYKEAQTLIIKETQLVFGEELRCIRNKEPLPNSSPLVTLNPIIDPDGILRVGGRLKDATISTNEKNPIIIPKGHHIATLLARHYHEVVKHQGRHLTEGAVRMAGYWIIGGKRLVSSIIHKCVKCRKLRGRGERQKMADLPPDRLEPAPPFTYVGLDTFGPWSVVTRRTRGGAANSKRWAILFTCLATRAIHLEVVEDMGTSSFVNALRRFIAIRGNVVNFRSDRGTNFVGSTDYLSVDAINVEDGPIKDFMCRNRISWIFNPPHSSHMGGVWERMIGITRRILDSMMSDLPSKNLTHEVLCTFMAEVSAIVNARPIVPVSSDPDSPTLLSPSMLLTQRKDHVTQPLGDWDERDLYKAQWRQVQALANQFWVRWRQEYLHTLQPRRKWHDDRPNVKQGDVVLLKDKNVLRNEWPVGIIEEAIPGRDGRVRKAVVRVLKEGKATTYTRPIIELVILLSSDDAHK